jgi:hypothetical protein
MKSGILIKIDAQKIDGDFSKDVMVVFPKSIANLMISKEQTVNVSVDVVAFLEGNKRLKIKKINFPRTVSLDNEEVTIIMDYLIDERNVEELKKLEFEAILDYSKRDKTDSSITVEVRTLPKFLDQVKVSPAILKLRYEN